MLLETAGSPTAQRPWKAYDVDEVSGFLPLVNVSRLPAPFDIWEDALEAGGGGGIRLSGGGAEDSWRSAVAGLEVMDIGPLNSLPLLRRGHQVLTFLLHLYVHSAPPPTPPGIDIPPSIGVPLLAICQRVGLPPILTYADLTLWNVRAADPAAPMHIDTNPPASVITTFTGTEGEKAFHIVSARCEAAAGVALRLIRTSLDELSRRAEVDCDDAILGRLTAALRELAGQIARIGDIVLENNTCGDPEVFYHALRPWFNGGNMDVASPWNFRGLNGELLTDPQYPAGGFTYGGPSAGQSSLIHAIDIFLTVDHSECNGTDTDGKEDKQPHIMLQPAPVAGDKPPPAPIEATFMENMLQYMPGPHRAFLLHLSSHPVHVRPLVVAKQDSHPDLAAAYDEALAALKVFRDKHMRIVTRFIVQQSRRPPTPRIWTLLGRGEEPQSDEQIAVDSASLKGSGGTSLVQFLKRCRDNTTKAMLSSG